MKPKFVGLALLLALGNSCTPHTSNTREPAQNRSGRRLHLCGAIRGNGARVFSTIASMASFTENYGTFDALAGASSGGIANFIYESVLMSPVLRVCGNGQCTDEVVRQRAGLMLKAFQGYIDYAAGRDSPEASPIWVVQKFIRKLQDKKIDLLLTRDAAEAFLAIHDILKDRTIRSLANKDILNFVDGVNLKQFRSLRKQREFVEGIRVKIQRIVTTAREGFKLERSDPELLVRTGLPNMPAIMKLIGRIGDFYVGRGPQLNRAGWLDWLGSCTAPTFRKPWSEIRGTACGKQFDQLVRQFHAFFQQRAVPSYRSRSQDPIGTAIPILNSTSMVIGGENVDLWKQKKARYEEGKTIAEWRYRPGNFQRDFKIGYWGNPQDLEIIERNVKSWGDYKSSLFFPLGQLEWWEVLSRSASEPGLNHALPYEDEHGGPLPLRGGERALTTGGWTDGHSVLVLRSLGCDRVVYVTRRGEDSGFAKGVAESLGMSDDEKNRLFGVRLDATEPYTSHELSLLRASGVWCTDWNKTPLSPDPLGKDGHGMDFRFTQKDKPPVNHQGAVFQTNPELGAGESGYRFFEDRRVYPNPWPRASAHTGLLGCEVRTPVSRR